MSGDESSVCQEVFTLLVQTRGWSLSRAYSKSSSTASTPGSSLLPCFPRTPAQGERGRSHHRPDREVRIHLPRDSFSRWHVDSVCAAESKGGANAIARASFP
jgi:hypothetical protein